MAYKTEIQIGVRGSAGVEKLRKEVDQLNEKLTKLENTTKVGILSITRYNATLAKAADSLRKVEIGTNDESIAIKRYVTALRTANAVQARQNKLIDQEITLRERAARMKALPKAVATTQFDSPIGPGPASSLSARPKRGSSGLEKFGEFGLGAGFPLLFGGGAGQVLGGGLGTLVGGGGPASFGLQIAFSAIGGQIEAALGRIREMDSALKALDMDALAESAITVNAELRQSVQNLVDMGANQQAVELAANAVLQQTGVLPESVSDASNAVTLLSNAWDQVVGAVSGLLSLVGTPLLSALTLVLKVVGQAVKGINIFVSTVGVGIKRLVQLIKLIPGGDGLLAGIENATKGVNEASEERLATLVKSGEQLDKEFRREQEIFGIEKRRVAGNTAAAKLTNAQATRDEALLKLKNATEDKLIAKRREFQGLTSKTAEIELFFQEQRIKGEAEIQKSRILQKFTIDEQNAALLRQKEIEKERKDLARELFEARVNESKIAQSGVQTQLNQLANDQKIFDLRQQTANVSLQLERAIFDAQLSTLQLEESRLQRELQRLQQKEIRFGRQKDLINAIAKNQARQAKIKFNIDKLEIAQGVAKAQIAQQQVQFEVQRIKLQIQLLKLKAEEIKDDKRRAAKFREIAATERQSNRLTQVMLQSAAQQLRFAVQIARQKGIIARNTLRGKLESIEAERVEKRRAVNAASLAKSTERIANASGSSGRGSGSSDLRPGQSLNSLGRPIILGEKSSSTVTTRLPIDDDVYEAVRRNIRTRDPQRYALELTAALDRAQAAKNARVAADERRRSELSAASYNYSQSRGLTGLSHNETTMVNVTTGPVLEFDGTSYVKMSDFREGLSTVARLTTRSSRYPGNRRFTGIR